VTDVRDLNDALDFPARFRAAVQGGIVEPVFSPGGKTFTFVEGAVTWEVDPQARSMHEVEPREAAGRRAAMVANRFESIRGLTFGTTCAANPTAAERLRARTQRRPPGPGRGARVWRAGSPRGI
jgi:hypothetical protein